MKRVFSLKGKESFKEVFLKGKRYQKKGIQVIVLRKQVLHSAADQKPTEKGCLQYKMAVCVNRHYGKAHERNKIKRQIRAIWDEFSGRMQTEFNVVIRPGRYSKPLEYIEKKYILQELLSQAGVISDENWNC